MTAPSGSKDDSAARRARADELRRQMQRPPGQRSPDSTAKPETPAEFVRRRMAELEQSSKPQAAPSKKRKRKS